ncbi:solute carrier family 49 member 4-like [Babylonia areolata]
MTRKQFWLVAMIYGTSLGTLNTWSSVLDVILKPHGINEAEAGWIGFYATCSACFVSLVIARFADFFKRIMKLLVLFSYILGTTAFVVFALTATKVIPPSNALFYVTIITGITALNAAVPLMFELSCELSYPVGEGTTNVILTIVNNIFGLIFLLLMMIPGIGSQWTIWVLVGTSGGCLPLLFFMKERYNRLEIDEHRSDVIDQEIVFPDPQH